MNTAACGVARVGGASVIVATDKSRAGGTSAVLTRFISVAKIVVGARSSIRSGSAGTAIDGIVRFVATLGAGIGAGPLADTARFAETGGGKAGGAGAVLTNLRSVAKCPVIAIAVGIGPVRDRC